MVYLDSLDSFEERAILLFRANPVSVSFLFFIYGGQCRQKKKRIRNAVVVTLII